jgi:gag-polypeptide of LTR copia-type
MLEGHARIKRYNITQSLIRCKMSEGSSVNAHVLKMMSYVQQLEKLGSPMDKRFVSDIILISLPPSYSQFIMIYHMLDMEKSPEELRVMLRSQDF